MESEGESGVVWIVGVENDWKVNVSRISTRGQQ